MSEAEKQKIIELLKLITVLQRTLPEVKQTLAALIK